MKTVIYWITKNPDERKRIREKFNIPPGRTINGETICEIGEEDLKLIKETELSNIQIRNK